MMMSLKKLLFATVFISIAMAIGIAGYLYFTNQESALAAGSTITAASAATYYIATNGSDSNNGTSTATPWLHAPGMSGCSSNCMSHTPSAGNSYILRGGDTFYLSGTWGWTWSGISGSRMYVGSSESWYTGGSWKKPKLHGGNALSAAPVASCTNTVGGGNIFLNLDASYVTIDNFEFLGLCWSGAVSYVSNTYIARWGTYNILSHLYFHGWTHRAFGGGTTDGATAINGTTQNNGGVGNQIDHVLCDGSDSDHNSFECVYGDCYDVNNSTFRHAANGLVCNNAKTFNNNLIEYIYNSADWGMHSNGLEYNSQYTANPGTTIYNNIFRHIYSAVGVWTCSCGNDYFYNNIMYDMGTNPWNVGQGWSCTSQSTTGNYGPGVTNFYNNTFVNVGMGENNYNWNGSMVNNHFINSTVNKLVGNNTSSVNQTVAQATAQGYTAENNYMTANASASTVNTGSSSPSSIFLYDLLGSARPQGTTWDIGAYEYLSPPPPIATSTYEAESCSLIAPMQIVSDSSASGGQYIQTSTSESGTATCSFSVSQADTYKITARVFAPNGGTDSFYFQIDNSPEDTYDLNPTASPSEYNVWREDDLTKRGTGTFDNPQYDPYTINLSSGAHTLALRGRESNARLDYFYLTRVTDITPPSAPSGLVVQ